MILCKAGSRTKVEDRYIKSTQSSGTYSAYDFSVKIKVVILQQKQYWEASQIKDFKLVIPGQ